MSFVQCGLDLELYNAVKTDEYSDAWVDVDSVVVLGHLPYVQLEIGVAIFNNSFASGAGHEGALEFSVHCDLQAT